jgi:cytosine/adenosine deaminase-related metal-dependent hydrolase
LAPNTVRSGHVVVVDGVITAIGEGPAQDGTLFQWLTTLYPLWGRLDADLEYASASAALGMLALTGCTTTMDHHYVFPRDGGDVLAAEINAAAGIGLRFHPTRGSMDLGASSGGLPPDNVVVEDIDTILAACRDAVARHHDPAFDSICRIALAPCSPFSVTGELMRQSAVLARELGVRLHTHLAETDDEEQFCLEKIGARPVDYVESLGWLGDDVWLAHCVHLSEGDIAKFAATGTGVAHCPSSNGRLGAGIAAIPELLAAGVPVGLGVDGVASNENGGLGTELWRLDGLGHADIEDPVCALVFGLPAPLERLLVGGNTVVSGGELRTADVAVLAAQATSAARRLRARLG